MNIRVSVENGLVGCTKKEVVEVPKEIEDNEDEIDKFAQEIMFDMISWSWERVEDEE